jgi:chromosome partitioning protein
MRTIVLASQKGGTGKSMLSSHLAVEAASLGVSVAVIDTDPQASLSAWWNVREAEDVPLVVPGKQGLALTLREIAKSDVDYCIIDTPGAANPAVMATIKLADLVVIPIKASPTDLRAVTQTIDAVNRAGRSMVFVINGVRPKTRLAAQAAVELSQHGTVAPVTVHDRQDFMSSMTDGRTAGELDPAGKSAAEIKALWAYITNRLAVEKSFGTAA